VAADENCFHVAVAALAAAAPRLDLELAGPAGEPPLVQHERLVQRDPAGLRQRIAPAIKD
jgi:hypothetical protein